MNDKIVTYEIWKNVGLSHTSNVLISMAFPQSLIDKNRDYIIPRLITVIFHVFVVFVIVVVVVAVVTVVFNCRV